MPDKQPGGVNFTPQFNAADGGPDETTQWRNPLTGEYHDLYDGAVIDGLVDAEATERATQDLNLQNQIDVVADAQVSWFDTTYGVDAAWTSATVYVNTNLAGKTYKVEYNGNKLVSPDGGSSYPNRGFVFLSDTPTPNIVFNPAGGFTLSANMAATTGDEFKIWGAGATPAPLGSYVSKAELYTEKNLITSFTGGAWSSSSMVISSNPIYSSANLIQTSPSAHFFVTGLTSLTTSKTNIGRVYGADAAFIASVPMTSVIAVTGGHRIDLPSSVSISQVGLFFEVGDVATGVKVYAGSVAPTTDIKESYLQNYLSKSQLLDQNILTGFVSGQWRTVGIELSASSEYSSAAIINTSQGTVYRFKGVGTLTINGTSPSIARLYTSAGAFVSSIDKTALVDIGRGYYQVTIPSGATIAKVGFYFNVDEVTAGVTGYLGDGTTTEKIKPGYLITNNSDLTNGAGYLNSATAILPSDIFDPTPTNLITSTTSGFYSSSATSTANLTASTTTYHTNLITIAPGGSIYIPSSLAGTVSITTLGKYVRANNTFRSGFSISSLVSQDGGWKLTVPASYTDVVGVILNIRVADIPDLGAYTRMSAGRKIDASKLPEFSNNDEDVNALHYYDAGSAPKVYTPLAIGIDAGGQSNQAGRIVIADLPSWYTSNGNKITDVLICNNVNGTFAEYSNAVFEASGTQWSYELLLFHKIIDYIKGVSGHAADKIYTVKYAVGGTAISPTSRPLSQGCWTPDVLAIPSTQEALILTAEKRARIAAATATGLLYKMAFAIWHQGESDNDDANNYYKNLRNVIAYKRGYYSNPNLPFIIGAINTSSTAYSPIVEAAKMQIADEDGYVFYAPVTNGLSYLKSDELHFNYAGGEDLATSMYNILMANKALFGLPQ